MADELHPERDRRRDVCLLVALVFLARAMAAFWFSPIHSEFGGFLFGFAALSDAGAYPFVHYWLEYPPLVPWISVGVYKLVTVFLGGLSAGSAGGGGATALEVLRLHVWYVAAMQWLMAAFDAGNVLLVYAIARRRWPHHRAFRAAWVYALLFFPALVTGAYFDGFVLFWLLLSVWLLLRGREVGSAAALAVGIVAKLVPVVFLPAALRYVSGWGRRTRYAAVTAGVVGLAAAPFLATDPGQLGTSLRAMAKRRPWETVWALIDGYTGYGVVGPEPQHIQKLAGVDWDGVAGPRVARLVWRLDRVYRQQRKEFQPYRLLSRFHDDLSFVDPGAHPTLYNLMAIPFLVVLAFVFRRSRPDPEAGNVLLFSLAALCLFLLYSKGWSPQFVVYPLAFCLLALGPYEGPILAVSLSVVNYVEMPMWLVWPRLSATAEATGLLAFAVRMRTVFLFGLLLVAGWRLCRKTKAPSLPGG